MDFRIANRDYDCIPGIKFKEEQIDAIDFALGRFNCIVGLKPGLGKTLVSLRVAYEILRRTKKTVCFILCPKEANTAFKKEFNKRVKLPYSVMTTEEQSFNKKGRFMIFNYSNLDYMEEYLTKCKNSGYNVFLVADEVHLMQSPDSNMSKRLRAMRPYFSCVIGLTGTPVLNALEGLWRIVDFVRPGFLGTYNEFRYRYIQYKKRTIRMGNRTRVIEEVQGYQNLEELKCRLEEIIITRGIDYNVEFIYKTCSLTEEEKKSYEVAAKGVFETQDEKHIPARLHDLQRIADGSHHLMEEGVTYSKCRLLVNTLREIMSRGEGVLVYTEYEDTYKTLGDVVKKYKSMIGYKNLYYITGKISYKKRVEVEQYLKAGDIVILTKAGCFAKGTKVVMADGSLKNVEDIKVGDYVMGRNSIPRRVEELHNGKDWMYRIKQSNAEDYIVNSQHILTLQYAYSRSEFGFKKGDILEITAEEFFKKTKNYRSHFRGFKEGYDCEDVSLRIKPYFLGLWLGDGSKNHAGLCVSRTESQLAEEWIAYGKSLGLDYRKQDGNTQNGQADWYFLTSHVNGKRNEFTGALREYGILGNKRIPEDYFRASRKQRLELLAGIINTDGWAHRESLGVSSTIKELAYDYKRLGDSLGYKTRVSKYQAKGFGKESVVYNVSFAGYFEDVPRLLEKKRPKVRRDFKTFNWSTVEIEEVGISEFYGFSIEGLDKLFMLEDGTVVHNCKSINLQAVNNVIVYNCPFAIGDLIQLIGRVTRVDTKYNKQNVYFLEVDQTIDTYKRLLVQSHASMIQAVFGRDTNLPFYRDVDNDVMAKYRQYFKNKFLWCRI